jgi:hypothetical protein
LRSIKSMVDAHLREYVTAFVLRVFRGLASGYRHLEWGQWGHWGHRINKGLALFPLFFMTGDNWGQILFIAHLRAYFSIFAPFFAYAILTKFISGIFIVSLYAHLRESKNSKRAALKLLVFVPVAGRAAQQSSRATPDGIEPPAPGVAPGQGRAVACRAAQQSSRATPAGYRAASAKRCT